MKIPLITDNAGDADSKN